MTLDVDDLRLLANLYEQWQTADALPVASGDTKRDEIRNEARANGEAFAHAFTAMIRHADHGAVTTLFSALPNTFRDAAIVASQSNSLDMHAPKPRQPGQHVGPYQLTKELGRGGMGVVWLAARADGSHARQVALKMPLVDNVNWMLAARFARERNILASLEHPGIARLYDAGLDNQGQPYIAIQYIAGTPITDYVRDKALKPDAVTALFICVTNAIAYAHTQLVIHRDIKPSNILVDANGTPHLLDFGIAKLLDDDTQAESTQLTRLAGHAFTLDYASPEQVRNERITMASDVYSLGVVLFELLTGKRPYTPKRSTPTAIADAIEAQEAPWASRVAARSAASRLRGDMDAILAKALKKDPANRYASAEAFTADLKRFQNGEPVLAQKDSTWYRTKKFVWRHAIGVAASATIFVAVVGGAGVAAWQAHSARIDAARSEQVKKFVASIFTGAVTRSGIDGQVLPADLLAAAAQRIDTEFAQAPRAAIELGIIVGDGFAALGEPEKAEDILRSTVQRAREWFGIHHEITIKSMEMLSESISTKDAVSSEALVDEALTASRKLLLNTAESAVKLLRRKSFFLARKNEPETAYAALSEAISIGEKHLGSHHKETILAIGLLSNTYNRFADYPKQIDAAQQAYDRAITAFGGKRPDPTLLWAEHWQANALLSANRPGDALPILQNVLRDQLRLDTTETVRVSTTRHSLAATFTATGRLSEALNISRELVDSSKKRPLAASADIARYTNQLLSTLVAARLTHEAQEVQATYERIVKPTQNTSPGTAIAHDIRTGKLLALDGHFDRAETRLQNAINEATKENNPRLRMDAQLAMAFSARLQNDPARAIAILQPVAKSTAFAEARPAIRAAILGELGASYVELGDFEQAREPLHLCSQLYESAQQVISPINASCVIALTRLHLHDGHASDAQTLIEPLAQSWASLNPQSRWHREAARLLAGTQDQIKRKQAIEANRTRADKKPKVSRVTPHAYTTGA